MSSNGQENSSTLHGGGGSGGQENSSTLHGGGGSNSQENSSTLHGGDGDDSDSREKLRHLQKEAFQLANYYFVFQGVIFTAIFTAPSRVKCEYRWIPVSLSSLAAFLNLCSFFAIACTYKDTLNDIDRSAAGGEAEPSDDAIAVKCLRYWRLFCVAFCMLCFLGFFVVMLVGCIEFTCRHVRR